MLRVTKRPLLDYPVRVHGEFPIRCITRTVAATKNEEIRTDYVDGAFRGEALWRFEGVSGKTRSNLRWRTTTSWVLRALDPLWPIEKSHSDTMTVGFERLREILENQARDKGGQECLQAS